VIVQIIILESNLL